MNLFDTAKNLMGALAGGQQAGLAGVVMQLISKEGGGLEGLTQKFAAAGLGDVIQGWISTGPNPAIQPEQLQAVLGNEMVQGLAAKAGLDPQALLGQLSGMLPTVIDQLTPDGVAPSADAIQGQLGGLLAGLLKKG